MTRQNSLFLIIEPYLISLFYDNINFISSHSIRMETFCQMCRLDPNGLASVRFGQIRITSPTLYYQPLRLLFQIQIHAKRSARAQFKPASLHPGLEISVETGTAIASCTSFEPRNSRVNSSLLKRYRFGVRPHFQGHTV